MAVKLMVVKPMVAGVMAAGLMATVSLSSASTLGTPADGGITSSASDKAAAAFDAYLAWVRKDDGSPTGFLHAMKGLVRRGQPEWARQNLRRWWESCREWAKEAADDVCSDAKDLLDSLQETSAVAVDAGAAKEAPVSGQLAQSVVDAAVEERLRAPALWRAYRFIDVKPGKRLRQNPVRFPVPEGDAIFAAREGKRAVVVATSGDVDPRGEVSLGGYVVYLSEDGGTAWRGPFHTGMAEGFPFVLRDNGGARVFDGEVLQLPGDMREIDAATITFPPLHLAAKRARRNCVVRIALSALEKDTDGDGLPDLLEERLATDPQSADTDGDGVPDAWDAIPLQQDSTVSPDGRFVAAALRAPLAFTPAIVPHPGGELKIVSQRPTQAPTAWVWRRTHFFVDEPIVSAEQRVVSLSPKAFEAYAKKLGPIYPIRVTTLLSDGHRAIVQLSESWRGSTSLVEEQADGSFSVKLIRKWVS
jgi:hypothetical protein